MLVTPGGSSPAIGGAITGATAGYVLYVGASGTLAQAALSGIAKWSGSGPANAVAGTDYVAPGGVAGGQTIDGGTGAGDNLTLTSTAHATKGIVYLNGTTVYVDASGNLNVNGSGTISASSNSNFGLYNTAGYPISLSGLITCYNKYTVGATNSLTVDNYSFGAPATSIPLRLKAPAAQTGDLIQWSLGSAGGTTLLRADGSLALPTLADSAAANNSLYYSSTTNKLTYKDPSGTLHAI